jgi:aspartyl protease family protein
MSGDDNASLIYGLICVMLLLSSLVARRLPLKQTMKMLLAWVAIFAGIFALFLFRGEFKEIWQRAKADFAGNAEVAADGTMRIKKDEDGHFNVRASVNGKEVDFLIDTGATVTTLNTGDARNANVDVDSSGFPVIVQTANGMAESQRARIATLNIGPISRKDFAVHVGDGLGDTNLLGMNFLSSLKGWRVEGDELVLNPD